MTIYFLLTWTDYNVISTIEKSSLILEIFTSISLLCILAVLDLRSNGDQPEVFLCPVEALHDLLPIRNPRKWIFTKPSRI